MLVLSRLADIISCASTAVRFDGDFRCLPANELTGGGGGGGGGSRSFYYVSASFENLMAPRGASDERMSETANSKMRVARRLNTIV